MVAAAVGRRRRDGALALAPPARAPGSSDSATAPEPRRQPRHRRARPCRAPGPPTVPPRSRYRGSSWTARLSRALRPRRRRSTSLPPSRATGSCSLPASSALEPESRVEPSFIDERRTRHRRHRRDLHLPDLQDRAAAARLGGRAARQVRPHPDARARSSSCPSSSASPTSTR